MNLVSWGYIFMKVPFLRLTLRKIISEPSPQIRLSIIQIGIWHIPSSAVNSSTPTYARLLVMGLLIINVIG